MTRIERRAFGAHELRVEGEGKRVLAGHAAVFNQLSEDLGGFREMIAPGAFAASITKDDIRALINHDPNLIIGRSIAKTLRLVEDEIGLAVGIDLPDTSAARDLIAVMERGDVTQMSFGFETISDKWEMKDGEPLRTLLAVRLWDVSPVTFPAYPQTEAALRRLDAWRAADARGKADCLAMMRLRTRLAEIA